MTRFIIYAVILTAVIGVGFYSVNVAFKRGEKSGNGLCRLSYEQNWIREKQRYDAIIQEQTNALEAFRASLPPSNQGNGLVPVVRYQLERMCDRAAQRGESTTSCNTKPENSN